MSTDQPTPPSIPPRPRPAQTGIPATANVPAPAGPQSGGERAASGGGPAGAGSSARTSDPGTGPTPVPASTGPSAAKRSERGATSTRTVGTDEADAPSVPSQARARAVAAGGAAAGAVRRAVRSAATAVVGTPGGAEETDGDTAPRSGPRTGAGAPPSAGARAVPRSAASGAATVRDAGPRRVRLSLSRVDPWSVMKLSFLLSFAIGIMIVVAAAVIWMVLDGLAVFTTTNDMITEIVGEESPIDLLSIVEFPRVVSGAAVVAIVDVVLLTALSTIGAFLYNITAALVGGVSVTLTDE